MKKPTLKNLVILSLNKGHNSRSLLYFSKMEEKDVTLPSVLVFIEVAQVLLHKKVERVYYDPLPAVSLTPVSLGSIAGVECTVCRAGHIAL